MAKSFKELLENYQEFMALLQQKVSEFCNKTGKYNAFIDVDNYSVIKILEDKIYIDVLEGEDYFEYYIPFYEMTLSENDKLLFDLRCEKTKYEVELHKANERLRQYNENLNKFVALANTYGKNSQYDIKKVTSTQNEFTIEIKSWEDKILEINKNIQDLINI